MAGQNMGRVGGLAVLKLKFSSVQKLAKYLKNNVIENTLFDKHQKQKQTLQKYLKPGMKRCRRSQDGIFQSIFFFRFALLIMRCGKLQISLTILYRIFKSFKYYFRQDALLFFFRLFSLLRTPFEAVIKKKSGRNQFFPMLITRDLQYQLVFSRIRKALLRRREETFHERVFLEIFETIFLLNANTVQQTTQLLEMAYENRAKLHFRTFWGRRSGGIPRIAK